MKRAHLLVRGLVQGVGFRPFIYNIAINNGLKGYVLNLGDAGVEIEIEGPDEKISKFIEEISLRKPQVAKIELIETRYEPFQGNFKKFEIAKSDEKKLTVRSVIPTDLSICDSCITDISRESRWKGYAFTSCAQCGPRFTIIKKLPYDRINTSMVEFPFCTYCQSEYDNPNDRRYDAQGITCPICGPRLQLLDKSNSPINGNPLNNAARLLEEGYIIAIKGIGGFHIAIDACNNDAVEELRKRRKRPFQPFAVMSNSINTIKSYATVSKMEEDLLSNNYHPIVSLRKSTNYYLSDLISPGLDTVGVMLPYTGIHHLLLKQFNGNAIVMTSGNFPGKPIFIENSEAISGLRNIVDYYLLHNRQIVNRCDDSVIKVINEQPIFLRKSRGYAPSAITTPWDITPINVLAVGGEYNITGSIQIKDRLITTQHIGDANELETLEYLKSAFNYIIKLYDITNFDIIAHDANPSFLTTRYAHELASEYGARTISVQHHHAHMASLMVDHALPKEETIVFIAIDGVGYGTDGMAWGGEIFVGGYSEFNRVAQLMYQPMPGGDACAYYPARMLASMLSQIMSDSEIINLFDHKYINYLINKDEELNVILKQARNTSTLKTSSMGRLLDAIAVLLDVCWKRTYEGEPPMRLEAFANKGHGKKVTLRLPISQLKEKIVLDTSDLIRSILEQIEHNNKHDIAYETHVLLGQTLGDVASSICDEYGLKTIGLGGGSAINSLISQQIHESVKLHNKKLLTYGSIPCGDGGTSCGQAISASART